MAKLQPIILEADEMEALWGARNTYQQWLGAPGRQVLLVDFGFAVVMPDGVLVQERVPPPCAHAPLPTL